MIVQIYAFTQIDEALAAVDLGVDQIGFVAGDYGIVHGELRYLEARMLVKALPLTVSSVALTMATEVDGILRMAEVVCPDVIHISTDMELVGVQELTTLRERISPSIKIMKAIHVEDERSLAYAVDFSAVSDILLLDTKVKGYPGVGATGKIHDWSISRRIVDSVNIPVILAGGLNPENVTEAIKTVRPWGVDSNTGTNIAGDPVRKDLNRIEEFVRAVEQVMGDG
jgi:phosphoribosylanthranilate isomerase